MLAIAAAQEQLHVLGARPLSAKTLSTTEREEAQTGNADPDITVYSIPTVRDISDPPLPHTRVPYMVTRAVAVSS